MKTIDMHKDSLLWEEKKLLTDWKGLSLGIILIQIFQVGLN